MGGAALLRNAKHYISSTEMQTEILGMGERDRKRWRKGARGGRSFACSQCMVLSCSPRKRLPEEQNDSQYKETTHSRCFYMLSCFVFLNVSAGHCPVPNKAQVSTIN